MPTVLCDVCGGVPAPHGVKVTDRQGRFVFQWYASLCAPCYGRRHEPDTLHVIMQKEPMECYDLTELSPELAQHVLRGGLLLDHLNPDTGMWEPFAARG